MARLGELKPLDASRFKKLTLRASAHELAADAAVDVKAGLEADRSVRLKHSRTVRNLLHVANAAEHLGRLPEPGESQHCIVKGNYPQWAMVPAMLGLAGPGATIDDLYIATLGFSKQNGDELLSLVDAGRVRRASALVSCYFKAHDGPIYDPIHAGLRQRGHRMLAMRTHAKIILARLSTGQSITIEGSANLRSCRNIEQFVVVNDPALFDFHAGWMEEIYARPTADADGKTEVAGQPAGRAAKRRA